MLEKPIITLTTDFGLRDPFVGIMKGVILGINPEARIVDISHEIPRHNVLGASQVIAMSYKYFPSTTIHVAVVDPGVGGIRKPLLVVTEDYYFIGPDNGVFTPVIEKEKHSSIFKVIHITSSHYYLLQRSSTFHGRDIFAPTAAWLSRGVESFKFGEQIDNYTTLSGLRPTTHGENTFVGEVIHIDTFGNAATNITKDDLEELSPGFSKEKFKAIYKGNVLNFSNYYSEIEDAELSVVINSFGFVELFIYKGNASEKFGIKIGDKVSVMAV